MILIDVLFGRHLGLPFPRRLWGEVKLLSEPLPEKSRENPSNQLDLWPLLWEHVASVWWPKCQEKVALDYCIRVMIGELTSPLNLKRGLICNFVGICFYSSDSFVMVVPCAVVKCSGGLDLGCKCGRTAKLGRWRAKGPAGVSDFRCWKKPWCVAHYEKQSFSIVG